MNKTKGATESEISKALIQWQKEYLGRGPIAVKTDILRDLVIVILRGILTPAEYALCKDKEGVLLIKKSRTDLIESGIEDLKRLIFNITDEEVVSFHTDVSTKTGERMMTFKLASNLEKKY
ncbi:DUF2294 domain-containing protein [Halalkalibacter flavus]|uniref:DUF2294 domain-containing protein n=1 Tax=Halalkalibacter flavus TaxID=3090668 RepID=UPI002FCA15E3